MASKVFISPDPNGWKVKVTSNTKASAICGKKYQAIQKGIEIAKRYHAELAVQNRDGRISTKNSYGSDPRRIKG